jgi:sulfur transfer protein SufE
LRKRRIDNFSGRSDADQSGFILWLWRMERYVYKLIYIFMTLRERQDQFIETIGLFDTWSYKFNFLIDDSGLLPEECPENLNHYRIENCTSRTCFKASNIDGEIYISGWSNSIIMAGIIVTVMKLFDGIPVAELKETEIDFHIRSGLTYNLTFMRQSALNEIIDRINRLKY